MKLHCLITLTLTFSTCFGQNLIPNPSFEDTIGCPFTVGQPSSDELLHAPPWYTTTRGTSDYFNQCNSAMVGVPNNYFGYQTAYSGVAYAGVWSRFNTANYREYISAPLLNSLQ